MFWLEMLWIVSLVMGAIVLLALLLAWLEEKRPKDK
jgi:hypothetical protein